MEIILKQDILNLGYKDEIVKVKDGYANNYLIPQGMALMATVANKKIHAENMRQRTFKEENIRKEAEALAASLNGVSLRIGAKIGANGQIFGSVNNIQIAEALKEQANKEVDRKKIVVDGDKIKEAGNYTATVHIHKDIKAEIKFEVIAE